MILGDNTTQYIGNYHNPLAKSPGIPTINQSAGVATSAHQVRSLGSAERFDLGILQAPWAVFPQTKGTGGNHSRDLKS